MNTNSKIIYHFFRGDMTFHVIPMITNILKYSKQPHYFVICISNTKNKYTYIDFFNKRNYKQYSIVILYRRQGIYNTLKRLCSYIFYTYKLILWRKNPIIAHGSYYPSPLYILTATKILNNVSIVEWCDIPDPNNRHLFNQIYIYSLKKMKHIICLLNDDRDSFMKILHRKDIIILPYITNTSDIQPNITRSNKKVLIGNRDIEFYTEAIDRLSGMTGLEVRFMCNYFKSNSIEYKELKEYAEHKLGSCNKLIFWNGVVSLKEYNKVVSNYDIYICASPTQSGLGAIYFCLQNGIKLYLTGRNKSWLEYNNFKVHSIEEINTAMSKEELFNYSERDIKYNKEHFEAILSRNKTAENWNQLYKELSRNKHN